MGNDVIKGVIRRRWEGAAGTVPPLASGTLRALELLKSKLIVEARHKKINDAIARQSRQ
jgi:hypothetical protein